MTTEKLHIELAIPKDWNGKQAKTVWKFLENIMEAIWDVHGDEIDEAIEAEERRLLAAARGETLKKYQDDDFPF
jgi:hypothetical protein